MDNYRYSRFCENLNIANFETTGEFNMPVMMPYRKDIAEDYVSFNCAKSTKAKKDKCVHFFIDDYQFERVWRSPLQYIDLLSEFHSVMTPDFSLYTDYPKAIQIYNHYRKQWLGVLWQSLGIDVIPTIAWSDKDSYAWCFDGVPKNAVVAVSSVGTQADKETKKLFLQGWEMMLKKLEPNKVIFYGLVPDECNANIIRVKAFQEKFREVKLNGW